MPRVSLTPHLGRHVDCPGDTVLGQTVGEVLGAYFARHPAVRSYVVDEQGHLRHHVVVFIDGTQASDRKSLSDPVSADAEIYIMQALSGGS